MSRNFELLQRAQRERDVFTDHDAERPAAAERRSAPALDQAISAEIGKLVQKLFFSPDAVRVQTVAFVGAEPGIGCTWVAARCAEILAAKASGNVCVIDADRQTPAMAQHFGLDGSALGWEDALLDSRPIEKYTHRFENLAVLPPGRNGSLASLTAEAFSTRMDELRLGFDHVLIDCPPLEDSDDALAIGKVSDGVVLVIGAHKTTRERASKVKEQFESSGIRILGAVLNRRTFPIPENIYRKL